MIFLPLKLKPKKSGGKTFLIRGRISKLLVGLSRGMRQVSHFAPNKWCPGPPPPCEAQNEGNSLFIPDKNYQQFGNAPYQYVFNNPYRYIDPNGESVLDFFVGLGEMIGGGVFLVGGGALELVTYGGFTWGVGFTTSTGAALMASALA